MVIDLQRNGNRFALDRDAASMGCVGVPHKNRTTVPKFQDISIKRKLTAIIMAASTVALLLVSAGFVTYELVTFRRTMAHDLSTLAEIIGNQSTAA